MNYKKLSAVLKFQGKDALAQKIYKERVITKEKEIYSFPRLNIGYFKSGSIIKLIVDREIYQLFNIVPSNLSLISYKIENSNSFLGMMYEKFMPTYFMFKSEGIKVHKQYFGDRLISKSCEPIDLDLEFQKDKNLKLAMIFGRDDCYGGRYDRLVKITSKERPELFENKFTYRIDE